jgi:hypothetical protein
VRINLTAEPASVTGSRTGRQDHSGLIEEFDRSLEEIEAHWRTGTPRARTPISHVDATHPPVLNT